MAVTAASLPARCARILAIVGALLSGGVPVAGDESPSPDPLLLFSTFLGGSSSDAAACMVRGPDGALWIAANSYSPDFPGAPRQAGAANGGDVVVLRFDTAARSLLSAAWIGSAGYDSAAGLAFDGKGNAYLAGNAGDVSTFPVTGGIPRPAGFGEGAFLARLLPDGSGFAWSVLIGGSGSDVAADVAVTPDGDPVVCGSTHSTDFPLRDPLSPVDPGGEDAFVARVRADGTDFAFSTLLGGSGIDRAAAVALTPAGRILVSGSTRSADFPATGRLLGTPTGSWEGYLAEIEQDGSAVPRAMLLGDSGVTAMRGEPGGTLLLLGRTADADFPAAPAPHGAPGDGGDAFLLRLEEEGWGIPGAVLFGGSGREYYLALDVGADGTAWVAGSTDSGDLPLVGAVRPLLGSSEDAFVASFAPGSLALRSSTYLGGERRDLAAAVAAEGDGTAWVAGGTTSADFPVVESLQPHGSPTSDYDLFLTHIRAGDPAAVPEAPGALLAVVAGGNAVHLSWEDRSPDETGFAVLRGGASGFSRIALLPADTTSWDDGTVLPDRTYAYAVHSFGPEGASPATAPVEVGTACTLEVLVREGAFRFIPDWFDGTSRLRLEGVLATNGDSVDGTLDPATEGLQVLLDPWPGEYPHEVRVADVPPGDPGWSERGPWIRWEGRGLRFDYRPDDGRFRLRFRGYGWSAYPDHASGLRVTLGNDAGRGTASWKRITHFRARIR